MCGCVGVWVWRSALRHGSSNMDVLIAMGTTAAYVYSAGVMLRRAIHPMEAGAQFFETSALLITCAHYEPLTKKINE